MDSELVTNTQSILVNTPTGFKQFAGVSRSWHEKIVKLQCDGAEHKVSLKHKFYCDDDWVEAYTLQKGMLLTNSALQPIVIDSVEIIDEPQWLYDLIDVDGGNAYIANGVINHNCEFLSSDSLLINSLRLVQLREVAPIFSDMGFNFWAPRENLGGAGKTYLVSLDPATGNGKDFSSIEIIEFPSMRQVGEYISNDINIPLIYAKLKWVLNLLSAPVGRGRAEVLWTFERNGVGEAIAALYFTDEKQPEHAELFSDHPSKLGIFTHGRNKIVSCLKLKSLVEKVNGGLIINSARLIFELKNFVSKGGGYEGKAGATDDCVMATVGIIRLLERLSQYDERAFEQVNEQVAPDADDQFGDEPVPFLM